MNPKATTFRRWLMQVAVAFLTAWLLQLFVLELIWIRSKAMQPTLYKGDFVLIGKWHYGARTPATWLKLPLTEPFIGDSIPTFLPHWQLPVFRLPGIAEIGRDDVLCFNHPREPRDLPADLRAKFIGRCVGLPGDSVKITALQVTHYAEDTLNKHYDYILFADSANFINYLQKKGFTDTEVFQDFFVITCTPSQAQWLAAQAPVRKVLKVVMPSGRDTESTFPFSRFFAWNKSFFGPLWIPRKGASVPVNDSTLALYDWLLEYEQGDKIRFSHDGFRSKEPRKAILNGKTIDRYTFTENYYFVLNDNRGSAEADSRQFGLIPEKLIIGKVWLAFSPNGFSQNGEEKVFFRRVK